MSYKPRVSYYYDKDVGNYMYNSGHPMKPHRMRMVNSLVNSYGLYRYMEVLTPSRATKNQMTAFHTDDYINFLSRVSPENAEYFGPHQNRFFAGDDCPVFEGLFEFCEISAGGSIDGAHKLNHGDSDIVVNWSGGLHHAKKSEASGFCYVNDIVLAILQLLRYHQRVLYVDIDVHHGDGVEEAFYTTDRVMTVSFHKFGEYFPGTGDISDVGLEKGKNYAMNVPLKDGMDDESYSYIFRSIVSRVIEFYRPGAIVLQCGADSLAGDRLGCFNLSGKGHGSCVEYVKSFNIPTLVLGGGGYSIRNVARAWTYETSVLVGKEVEDDLPYNEYYNYYGPEYKLNVPPNNMANLNDRNYLDKIKSQIYENMRSLPFAPSVQIQDVPRDFHIDSESEENDDPDIRISEKYSNSRRVNEAEFSDSEDEGEGRRNIISYAKSDFPNPKLSIPSTYGNFKKNEEQNDIVPPPAVTSEITLTPSISNHPRTQLYESSNSFSAKPYPPSNDPLSSKSYGPPSNSVPPKPYIPSTNPSLAKPHMPSINPPSMGAYVPPKELAQKLEPLAQLKSAPKSDTAPVSQPKRVQETFNLPANTPLHIHKPILFSQNQVQAPNKPPTPALEQPQAQKDSPNKTPSALEPPNKKSKSPSPLPSHSLKIEADPEESKLSEANESDPNRKLENVEIEDKEIEVKVKIEEGLIEESVVEEATVEEGIVEEGIVEEDAVKEDEGNVTVAQSQDDSQQKINDQVIATECNKDPKEEQDENEQIKKE